MLPWYGASAGLRAHVSTAHLEANDLAKRPTHNTHLLSERDRARSNGGKRLDRAPFVFTIHELLFRKLFVFAFMQNAECALKNEVPAKITIRPNAGLFPVLRYNLAP